MILMIGFNKYDCKPMQTKQWLSKNRNHINIGMSENKKFYDIWEVAGKYYYDEDEIECGGL